MFERSDDRSERASRTSAFEKWWRTPCGVKASLCRSCEIKLAAATDMAGAALRGWDRRHSGPSREAREHNEGATRGKPGFPREASGGAKRRRDAVGAYRDRTGDLRLAKPALSQLS